MIEAQGYNAYLLRIGAMFYTHGLNTREIADLLKVSEAQIWADMNAVHERWSALSDA